MPDPSLLQRLKERKLVQWALAYLAGAFVVFQLLDALAEPLAVTTAIQRAILVVVSIGFCITLVLAWYHGEKGRQRVSGPELLIIAVLLVIAGTGISLLRGREEATEPTGTAALTPLEDDRPGIAVLPCTNTSPDPADEYLAASLHDEILLKLQGISSLFSIGRASVEWYRDHPAPLTQVARELGVGFVGQCSVQKHEEQIRLIFQLLDGGSGGQLWAEEYDRRLSTGNLFDVQSDIARQVAYAIGAVLTPEEQARVATRPTDNLAAYELYLRGRYFWNRRTELSSRTAISYFEQAIDADPGYAAAYAGLADSYNLLSAYGYLAPEDGYTRGRAAALKALEIDSTLAEAHTALGFVMQDLDSNLEGAERSYRRAIELDPSYATAHQWYALLLVKDGRDEEGIRVARQALRLDPLSLIINRALGRRYLEVGDYDLAAEQFRRTLEMDPTFYPALMSLGELHLLAGDFPSAIAALESAVEVTEGAPRALAWLACAFALSGQEEEALALVDSLEVLSGIRWVSPDLIAGVLGAVGEEEQGGPSCGLPSA